MWRTSGGLAGRRVVRSARTTRLRGRTLSPSSGPVADRGVRHPHDLAAPELRLDPVQHVPLAPLDVRRRARSAAADRLEVAGTPAREPERLRRARAATPYAAELGYEARVRAVAPARGADVEPPRVGPGPSLGEVVPEVRAHRLRQQDGHRRLRAGALPPGGEQLRDVDRPPGRRRPGRGDQADPG